MGTVLPIAPCATCPQGFCCYPTPGTMGWRLMHCDNKIVTFCKLLFIAPHYVLLLPIFVIVCVHRLCALAVGGVMI